MSIPYLEASKENVHYHCSFSEVLIECLYHYSLFKVLTEINEVNQMILIRNQIFLFLLLLSHDTKVVVNQKNLNS